MSSHFSYISPTNSSIDSLCFFQNPTITNSHRRSISRITKHTKKDRSPSTNSNQTNLIFFPRNFVPVQKIENRLNNSGLILKLKLQPIQALIQFQMLYQLPYLLKHILHSYFYSTQNPAPISYSMPYASLPAPLKYFVSF